MVSVPLITGLPSAIRLYTQRLESIIAHWPIPIPMDSVIRWVLQFDVEDYSLAVRILENLDVLGPGGIRAALEVAHAKLVRQVSEKGTPIKGNNTLFAGIGSSAKSGALVAYHYRVAVELSEDDFFSSDDEQNIDFAPIENIVLVDDVIGTGKTVASEVKRLAEEVYALSRTRNIFVLTIAGYQDGIQRVTDDTGASVVCALEYSAMDTVASLDASFYDGMPVAERSLTLDRIKRYCRAISKSELGYGGVGGLLVFDHNTPNTTLPLIWHNGKGWTPLFPRARRIHGSAKVLKSAQRERSQEASIQNTSPPSVQRDKVELTLFVEGRTDEMFVDYLRMRYELAARLQVGELNAIALGGMSQSRKLMELLKSTKKYAIFIVDDDRFSRSVVERNPGLSAAPMLFLAPNFVAMLDIEKIYSHRERFPGLPEREPVPNDERWFHEVEVAVLRRRGMPNQERVFALLDEFLDLHKYEVFVSRLKEKVDSLFA